MTAFPERQSSCKLHPNESNVHVQKLESNGALVHAHTCSARAFAPKEVARTDVDVAHSVWSLNDVDVLLAGQRQTELQRRTKHVFKYAYVSGATVAGWLS